MSDHEPADTDLSGATSAAISGPPDKQHSVLETREQAFSAFYRSAMKPLVGFLVNQGATVHVATDIAQETMEAAFRRWHELVSPRAWVHTVASRALVRKTAAIEEEPVDELPEPTSLLPHPDAIAEWEARYDTLPVLRDLPPRQRQVLAWTLIGYTPTDIAKELRISAEAVRSNLRKARRAAARHLKSGKESQ